MSTAVPIRDLETWFAQRLPQDWFEEIEVLADPEEILVIGTLPEPPQAGEETPALRQASLEAAIADFREGTRRQRIAIAREAERSFRRTVSWGARCGGVRRLFTTNTIPVMTRLRLPERRVIDTLVAAGVARSRSEALAWCVRRVADAEADWLAQLREAFTHVESVRAAGPDVA